MKKNIALMAAGILLVFSLYVAVELFVPLPFGNRAIEFEIKKGATFRQVVEGLSRKGLVRDRWVFLLLGRITGLDRKIKAGYYPLWGTMRPIEIFDAFRLGRLVEYEIMVLPGDSLREIAEKFASLGMIEETEFLRLSTDRDLLDLYNIDAPSLEGYLFPDTYRFPKGLEVREVISMMIANLREKYDAGMLARTSELGLTERDVLTMASIIEKEAVTDSERPIIAAVYYNRLKRHMPLQADPTAIYGIKSHKERITRKDLLRKTAYNTYIIKGLPPGPIASPGLKSIKAALYPAEVPYLYFVSNNDGTHNFSVTLGEHSDAVKSYRAKKGNNG